jgi:phosphate:Na+ symporter
MVNHLCDAVNGIYYQAILTNIEHISDKCSDIAVYILEGTNKDIFGNEHSYVHELHHSNDAEYMANYQKEYDKYFSALGKVSITDAIEAPEEPSSHSKSAKNR